MVSLCCDYGVEHLIPRMKPFALRDRFPFDPIVIREPAAEDVFADDAEIAIPDDVMNEDLLGPCISMHHLLPAVGLIHEVHIPTKV